ncbi:DUF5825 family protein [Kitasatospora viridis]|uniref:Uncharacterized protein n=1 Tax=Kitasatospora viridis TaxID=281105 RepID=A0A561UBJ6_9ACTN|nr:DUF5825 family protein [Kitasatospora viridis]TWF96743.1 hypothetical protein FHX73_11515 [Kitasatospora viridis]
MLDALGFVADLRDRTARGERVDWQLEALGLAPDPELLCHLAPPAPDQAPRWHELHRFGLLYYRRGPGFVIVYDARPTATAAQLLLDDPDELRLFDRLARPGPLASDDPAARRLRTARLVMEVDGWAVALPYRESRLVLPLDIMCMPSNVSPKASPTATSSG